MPGKTSGCSIAPAATTTLPARILTSVSPWATGDEAVLEEADRDRGREQLDAGLERLLPELGGLRVPSVGEQRAADVRPLVDDDHAAPGRRGGRRLEARLPAADHDDVGVLVDDLDALARGAPFGSSFRGRRRRGGPSRRAARASAAG